MIQEKLRTKREVLIDLVDRTS